VIVGFLVQRIAPGMAHARSPVIVAIADGRVIEVGSHDQLMAAKGLCHDSA
jgi:ABC-type transport system involved in Fe-S cluster assembly fused permease/ATPase subunit